MAGPSGLSLSATSPRYIHGDALPIGSIASPSGRKTTVGRPVRYDAHSAEHGRTRGATNRRISEEERGQRTHGPTAYRSGQPASREAKGVRFHPGALRNDAMSPLYDLPARPGGAREERMRSGVGRIKNRLTEPGTTVTRGGGFSPGSRCGAPSSSVSSQVRPAAAPPRGRRRVRARGAGSAAL